MDLDLDLLSIAVVVPRGREPAEWYRDKLDFEVKGEVDGHWVIVRPKTKSVVDDRGPAYGIHLCEADELEPGTTGILFLTDDIEATIKEMKERGVEFTHELTKAPWGTFAMFTDPYGNEFWLMPRSWNL